MAPQTDLKTWWFFDRRTRTIRSYLRPNFALSNPARFPWAKDLDLVARSYRDGSQMLIYRNGQLIQNPGASKNAKLSCVGTRRGYNQEGTSVVFETCKQKVKKGSESRNQFWGMKEAKFDKAKRGSYPIRDGLPFFLRSGMKGAKMDLMWEREHVDDVHERHRLFMQKMDGENKQALWTFDSRTRSIRAFHKRTHTIGQHDGKDLEKRLFLEYFMDNRWQRVRFTPGQTMNYRNEAGRCLTRSQYKNHNDKKATQVRFIHCSFGSNLDNSWKIVKWTSDMESLHKIPVADGQSFILRSKMAGGKVIKWNKNAGLQWEFHNQEKRQVYIPHLSNFQPTDGKVPAAELVYDRKERRLSPVQN
jgi:hypothetical protein